MCICCSYRLHVLANTEDNSDTGELELIRHLHVNVSSLKILLQGTIFDMNVHVFENMIFREFCLCHCCKSANLFLV